MDSDILSQKPHPDLAGQVQIISDIFDSVPEKDWEILQRLSWIPIFGSGGSIAILNN